MTEWHRYLRYFCKHCSEECINHLDRPRTQIKECWNCYQLPDLRDDSPPQSPSFGEASRVSGGAGANGAASGEPAGSDPLRVDPEAGAYGPDRRDGPTGNAVSHTDQP